MSKMGYLGYDLVLKKYIISGIRTRIKTNILAANLTAALTSHPAKTRTEKEIIRIATSTERRTDLKKIALKRIAQIKKRTGVIETKINIGVRRTSIETRTRREATKTNTGPTAMETKSPHHHHPRTRSISQKTETRIETKIAIGVIRTNTAVIRTGTPVLKINIGKKN